MRSALLLVAMVLFDVAMFAISGTGVVLCPFAVLMGGSSPFLVVLGLSIAGLIAAVLFGLRVIVPMIRETAKEA